jgi:decaprenyl-phosphate phosphoribosyltransferase
VNLAFVKVLRPKEYIKNLFIFAPLFFSFNFTREAFVDVFIVCAIFSITASSVYIFNDLLDLKEDQKHPTKKLRALANNEISPLQAKLLALLLATTALISSYFTNKSLFFIILFYLIMNIAYSIKLKHIALLDIFIIATGFVLRLYAGASVIEAPLSMWIIIMTFLLSLLLAISKRKEDLSLLEQGIKTRRNINEYNKAFIDSTINILAAVIIVSYLLYCVSQDVTSRLNTTQLYISASFVLFAIMRYIQITYSTHEDLNPTNIIWRDRILQLSIILWLMSFLIITGVL